MGTGSFRGVKCGWGVTLTPHTLLVRGQERVELYLYSPMRRMACTEPQCLYSVAIPLSPYGPYSLYRASVPVQYSYKSTPPMGRTVCPEPQCL